MFKRETMKADSWKLSLGFGLLWNLFETQGSFGNKFLGLSFLWQNSMKVAIKVWIWLLLLYVWSIYLPFSIFTYYIWSQIRTATTKLSFYLNFYVDSWHEVDNNYVLLFEALCDFILHTCSSNYCLNVFKFQSGLNKE